MNEEQLKEFLDGQWGDGQEYAEERAEMESQLRALGHGDNNENISKDSSDDENNNDVRTYVDDPKGFSVDELREQSADNNSKNNDTQLNASNVVINASNVKLEGNDSQDLSNKAVNINENSNKGQKDDEEQKGQKKHNDDNVSIVSEGTDDPRKIREKSLLGNMMAVATGQKGLFETLAERPKSKLGREIQDKINDGSLKLREMEDKADSKPKKYLAKKARGVYNLMTGNVMNGELGQKLLNFEKMGGMTKLHAGFNSIRDTFFVGGAPQDWKATNARMKEKDNAYIEQLKFDVTNLDKNKWLVNIYETKLREQYKDREKYSDARIHEMAKDQAKAKLKGLSDTYVPLGVLDMKMAYELEEDRKEYGLSAKDVVKERVAYEKFNINQNNINYLEERYDGVKTESVSEAIPPAKEYYNQGYKNVKDMALLNDLTKALGVSEEMGIKLDQVLRRKDGKIKIDYEKQGIEGKQKDKLDKILKEYQGSVEENK